MKKEIVWLPQAESDFAHDVEYLDENYGRKTSTRYMEAVYDTLEKISNADLVAYQLVDAEKGVRRCKVTKTKYVYYRILNDCIELLTFRDTQQNSEDLKL
jgi:plasmid stabilization system protein ParE